MDALTWIYIALAFVFSTAGGLWLYHITTAKSGRRAIAAFTIFAAICCFGLCLVDILRLF